MKKITINNRELTINVTLGTLCEIEKKIGKPFSELWPALQEPMKNLSMVCDIIDIVCGEAIARSLPEFRDFNPLMIACSEEIARFFDTGEKPKEEAEGERPND